MSSIIGAFVKFGLPFAVLLAAIIWLYDIVLLARARKAGEGELPWRRHCLSIR